jgi:yecA family protein
LSSPSLIEFDEFCELLMPLGALNSPSELHGLLCGKLCGGLLLTTEQWLKAAWDVLDIAGQPNAEVEEPVLALYEFTKGQLDSGDYNLQPYLPDDFTEMEQRLQALSQWCHGFLAGFGSAGIDPNAEFSSDQADSLRDIAAIVQVALDEDEKDEEEQESDFSDLVEHVRIIVMNFYEDNLQDVDDTESMDAKPSTKSIH